MATGLELQGGIAFVTGGASGIGEACAKGFVREGVRGIALADLSQENLERVAKELKELANHPQFEVLTVQTDCSKDEDCQRAVSETAQKFGRIDFAVNSAGISKPRNKIETYTDADWNAVMNVNLNGVFYSMRAEIQQMLKQEPLLTPSQEAQKLKGTRGSIVNIASVLGLVGVSSACAYTAAKHGVVGITKNAAAEAGENLIRVNAVSPGFILTPLMKTPVQFAALDKIADLYCPSKRSGLPDEVASTVLFQSSPRSSFVNGATWTVDGGYTSI